PDARVGTAGGGGAGSAAVAFGSVGLHVVPLGPVRVDVRVLRPGSVVDAGAVGLAFVLADLPAQSERAGCGVAERGVVAGRAGGAGDGGVELGTVAVACRSCVRDRGAGG